MRREAVFIISLLFVMPVCAGAVAGDSCKYLEPDEFYLRIHSAAYPLILDTRTQEEFARDRIPGAILVENRAELEKMADSLDREQPIFVYCDNDTRSPVACRILCRLGFKNVYDLKGGIIAWEFCSYELDRERIRKRKRRSGD